jgi:hypothetical protein
LTPSLLELDHPGEPITVEQLKDYSPPSRLFNEAGKPSGTQGRTAVKEKQRLREKEKKIVLTPGGPRPASFVHKLNSEDILCFDQKGRAHVAPGEKKSTKKQHK